MVALLFLIAASAVPLWADSSARLITECNKPRVFQGEIFTCQYILYSAEDRVEIEVSKFPEFRGYWSENTALRQGPLMMLPEMRFPGLRKAIVGSYQLTSMRGSDAPQITPMHIVLRTFGMQGAEEQNLTSEMQPLSLLPLPPVPPLLAPRFNGAVGHFTLRAETSVVRFFPEEPVVVRYILTGAGNYSEINSLQAILPEGVKLVSERSTLVGTGSVQAKTFDLTLTVQSDTPTELPPLVLTYFEPPLNRFSQTQSEPIRLYPLPKPPTALDPHEEVLFGPLSPHWHAAVPVTDRNAFRFVHFVLALLWLAALVRTLSSRLRKHRENNPVYRLKKQWKTLLSDEEMEAGAWGEQAESLVFETVRTRSRLPLVTRQQALEYVKKRWGQPTADTIAEMVKRVESQYSPNPAAAPPLSLLKPRLRGLRRTLFGRFRS